MRGQIDTSPYFVDEITHESKGFAKWHSLVLLQLGLYLGIGFIGLIPNVR
ncbi:hypothetical protein TRICHSKD4_2646 [Roseibium sp. TrichSKD4]|nr:hypothetical protein TRICHSKD4_2646 [Roseibium sp. TrichSKD4]